MFHYTYSTIVSYRYLCQGASSLHTHHEELQQQFEELQNALDLVGFESEVS